MVTPIPKTVQQAWEKWNIRGVILLSLSLQTFLILFAPMRKRTHRSLALWSIWLAYLLADWAASFCIGLISKITDDNKSTKTTPKEILMAFWAPFLLLHLGGPDTITAFSLEDNELWLRHLLALVFQAVAAAYVFLLTIPGNTLWIPTLFMFLAGLVKYAERTRALYLASMNTFRRSMVRAPDPGPNYAKLMEEQYSREEAGIPTNIEVMGEPDRKPKKASHLSKANDNVAEGTVASRSIKNVDVVNDAYDFFDKFKGLIVDMIYSFGERNESREKFLNKSPEEALRVIEVELNYIYEVFYTKVSVVRSKAGYFFRFLSFASIVVALGLFIVEDKNVFHKFDVKVTYTLLYGAVALDVVGFLLLIFSDRTVVSSREDQKKFTYKAILLILERFLGRRKPMWSECKKGPYIDYMVLSTPFLFRRWCGIISGHNLITYCLRQCASENPNLKGIRLFCFKVWKVLKFVFDKVVDYFGAREILDVWIYKTNNPFLQKLWKFIMEELRMKSENAEDVETTQMICSSRGEWILQEGDVIKGESVEALLPFVKTDKVTFDESLILWHIATQLCYANDQDDKTDEREYSKLLSDYMLYLLVMQPTLMSAVAGIGQIRFQDTCAEAIKFFSKRDLEPKDVEEGKQVSDKEKKEERKKEERMKEACRILLLVPTDVSPFDVKGDRSKSLLFDACRLAKKLQELKENKWKIISQVWVEMLSFAACNCRPTAFVQQLSKGGELVSIVWLLMVHLGLGMQFQIKDGHARAKLIVAK